MINKDLKNNRYRISVGSGKERVWRSAKTYKEAKRIESELLLKVKGMREGTKTTVDGLFSNFLEYSRNRNRKTTVEFYEKCYVNHIKDQLGWMPITQVDYQAIERWKASVNPDLSKVTKGHIYTTLHALFNYSDKVSGTSLKLLLDKAGPFLEDPNKLSDKKDDLKYWSVGEFEQFIQELKKECESFSPTSKFYMRHWSTYVLMNILFYSGLRKGEANALQIKDFHDGVKPYLDVNKSATCKVKGNQWIITDPKNKTSIRKVPVPNILAEIMREHINTKLAHLPVKFTPDLFLVGGVQPLSDSTYDTIKRKIENKIHLSHISIHDLRHSYVSVLINNGVPLTTISKLVGHSSTAITWKIYSHLYPETLSEAANVFDRLATPMPKQIDVSKGDRK